MSSAAQGREKRTRSKTCAKHNLALLQFSSDPYDATCQHHSRRDLAGAADVLGGALCRNVLIVAVNANDGVSARPCGEVLKLNDGAEKGLKTSEPIPLRGRVRLLGNLPLA